MQRVRPTINGISNTNPSRISNGTKLAVGIDGRSPEARRFRDVIRDFEAEFEAVSSFDRSPDPGRGISQAQDGSPAGKAPVGWGRRIG